MATVLDLPKRGKNIKTKGCTKCKKELPVENFCKNSRHKSGRDSWCKNCRSKATRAWQIGNPERDRENKRVQKAKNPIGYWVTSSLSKHRCRGFDIKITHTELEEMAKKTTHCVYCETELNWSVGKGKPGHDSPTLDRIQNGKIIDKGSSQIICNRCNGVKGNEFGDTLRRRLEGMLKRI